MNQTLSLLHLSDLHICNTDLDYIASVHGLGGFLFGGPALQSDFPKLRRAIEARTQETDWLIITGDLTHTGRVADLRDAREFVLNIESDFLKGANRGGCSLALLPGNHDRYKNKGPEPGNVGPFEDKFKRFWNIGQSVQFSVLSEELRVQAGFADFSLQEKDAFHLPSLKGWGRRHPTAEEFRKWAEVWGAGCVHEGLLEELAASSASRIEDGWRIIWIIHFAPFHPGLGEADPLRLRNEEKLISRAKELGITHIFCGHTHAQNHYTIDGVEVFCAGQSLRDSRFARAHFFAVELEIIEGRLSTRSCVDVTRSLKSRSYVGKLRVN